MRGRAALDSPVKQSKVAGVAGVRSAELGRFLIVGEDAGGTVPPMLAVAESLIAAGQSVTYLSQPSVEARAVEVGCEFVAFETIPDYRHDTAIEEQLAIALPMLVGRAAGDQLIDLAADIGCVAVIVDSDLAGAAAAAETLHRPSAVLLHHLYGDFVVGWFHQLWPALAPSLNATRDEYGLAPVDGWSAVFAPHPLVAVAAPPGFDPVVAGALGGTIREPGFLVPRGSTALSAGAPPGIRFGEGSGPRVVVGLSSTYQAQERLFQNILDALGTVDAAGLATTTRAMAPGDFTAPANVTLATYVPHAQVVPMADVVVTHAGLGTLAVALAAGVPVVCAPIARDQHSNADCVSATGAGVVVAQDATPDEIAAAISSVVSNPSYRAAAERMASNSRDAGGAPRLASELIALANNHG
jgi:UDP:flavonoid glycosyltransferase YjiC (YdhE family)